MKPAEIPRIASPRQVQCGPRNLSRSKAGGSTAHHVTAAGSAAACGESAEPERAAELEPARSRRKYRASRHRAGFSGPRSLSRSRAGGNTAHRLTAPGSVRAAELKPVRSQRKYRASRHRAQDPARRAENRPSPSALRNPSRSRAGGNTAHASPRPGSVRRAESEPDPSRRRLRRDHVTAPDSAGAPASVEDQVRAGHRVSGRGAQEGGRGGYLCGFDQPLDRRRGEDDLGQHLVLG